MKKLADKIKIRVSEKLYLRDPNESSFGRSIVTGSFLLIRLDSNLSHLESWLNDKLPELLWQSIFKLAIYLGYPARVVTAIKQLS